MSLIDKRVEFKDTDHNVREGTVEDKVCIPVASGHNEYVEFDQYVIATDDGKLYLVNPLFVIRIIK